MITMNDIKRAIDFTDYFDMGEMILNAIAVALRNRRLKENENLLNLVLETRENVLREWRSQW